jgi:hypothetical protein
LKHDAPKGTFNMARPTAIFLVSVLLLGCSSQKPVPRSHTYEEITHAMALCTLREIEVTPKKCQALVQAMYDRFIIMSPDARDASNHAFINRVFVDGDAGYEDLEIASLACVDAAPNSPRVICDEIYVRSASRSQSMSPAERDAADLAFINHVFLDVGVERAAAH